MLRAVAFSVVYNIIVNNVFLDWEGGGIMGEFGSFGKVLIITGIILIIAGALFLFVNKIPFLGRLPGDIAVQKKNFSFYFPLTTCIIISIVLSIIMWLLGRK
ncbi:hypothetical protein KSMBR1_0761 [Candidatus Kuenenia stuttgartiensis]|jgi:hypothetical protein|uniref:DUF2905 domain-containing protein n=2 Tax=Candidatus Brocadiaceae TaxID=1127830 RepID=A0A2C9CC48_KUEST|nr:hypothetical protein KSMBR1_0761 [Candidatus Kuenenia stuttgartiensis]